jgi:hypothetical protein
MIIIITIINDIVLLYMPYNVDLYFLLMFFNHVETSVEVMYIF